MKKILFFLLFISISGKLYCQDVVIPQAVSTQLTALFTSASDIKWTSPAREKYEAKFNDSGIVKTVLFSHTGDLLQVLIPIAPADFPLDVSKSLSLNFPDFEIRQSMRIEIGREISFRLRVRKGRDLFEVELDILGKIKSKIKIGTASDDEVVKKECTETGDYCERHKKRHKGKGKGHYHKKQKETRVTSKPLSKF